MYIFREILRSLPLMIIIFEFMNSIINQNKETLLFTSSLVLNLYIINSFLKRLLYNIFGSNIIINRPIGARNCGFFNNNKLSKTSGMPSGHSQGIGFWAGYKIRSLLKNSEYNKLSILFIIIISILTCCARLNKNYIGDLSAFGDTGCHTPLQVIIGFLIGFVLGWVCEDIITSFLNKYKKKN